MTSVNPPRPIPPVHEIEIRVRYQETDAQGRVHHANYINYFEIGRVELLRASGRTYRQIEQEEGFYLVVTEIQCQYFIPAVYDDLLRLRTSVVRARGVRIQHRYELFRDNDLLAVGTTTIACVDRSGRIRRLPAWLTEPARKHTGLAEH